MLSIKETPEDLQPKDHLAAHGFEENCLNKNDKESLTCFKDTLQTILAAMTQNDWHLRSIDIKTAFLQGEKLNLIVHQNIFES